MEKYLRQMFDFQRFAGNGRLEELIRQAEDSYAKALSDVDLGLVNAAGVPGARHRKKDIPGEDE